MNVNQLAAFHAVAEIGSVTRAGEHLMVSQPAVSKQIKQLESALKTSLIVRQGRGIRLTDAGEVLASYARTIFGLVAEAESALKDLGTLRRGTLSIGTTPTIGTYLLPEALVYFRQRFPGIHVTIETADKELLAKRLLENRIEIALADETLVFPGMQRRRFMTTPFVAIAPPTHSFIRRRRDVSLIELATEPLIMREAGVAESSLVEQFLTKAGIAPTSTLTLGTTEAVKRAVQSGLGLAIVPRISIEGEIASKRLAIVRMPALSVARDLYEVWNSRRNRGKAAQAFHCVLEHLARGTLPKPRASSATAK